MDQIYSYLTKFLVNNVIILHLNILAKIVLKHCQLHVDYKNTWVIISIFYHFKSKYMFGDYTKSKSNISNSRYKVQ